MNISLSIHFPNIPNILIFLPIPIDQLNLSESSSASLNQAANQPNARQALDSHSNLLELIDELKLVESACNPKLPSRNEQSWSEFINWVDSELSSGDQDVKLSKSIGISGQSLVCKSNDGSSDQEFSLIAKEPFRKGQKIFSIQRRLMLSTETADKDSDLFDFIMNDSIASAMQNVALVLHLLNEYSKGSRSYWAPYLAILPSKTLPVLKLNKEKLNNMLASSHLFEALKMIRAIARQYSYFFKLLQSTNLPLKKDFTFEYYCWGVSIVCSRQNEIPPEDRRAFTSPVVHALIPILDMSNHDRMSNQAIFENNQSCLMASKDLNAGDEITINYGCRTSGEFYIHNGFVPDEVPFDIVPLMIALDKSDHLFVTKSKLLKALNMPASGRFKLTYNNYENRHKRDPHLTMFLIVYFLSEDELDFVLDSDNPVGIADEIYEYVQYKQSSFNGVSGNGEKQGDSIDNDASADEKQAPEIEIMKKRLCDCVKEYLSKRASVGIALIDRALNQAGQLDNDARKLLEHEKAIYKSHLINCAAK